MRAKHLKEWAYHLMNLANRCDDPITKAFIAGKADSIGLEYLSRKDNDENFREELAETVDKYYEEWYKIMDKYL